MFDSEFVIFNMFGCNFVILRYLEGVYLFFNLNLVMVLNFSLYIIYMFQLIRIYVDKMSLLVEYIVEKCKE